MPFVDAERLGFSYSDRVCLLKDVYFRLVPGWHGLVGANGQGKTTLARLIAGELAPTSGRLRLEPVDARVVVCRQEVAQATSDLFDFAHSDEREPRVQRGLLNLDPATLARWNTLSPGERKRWQLGAALAAQPDVLILDEPTNHLDSAAREHLIPALRRFSGVGVVISHDRELLATLTHCTLRVQAGSVQSLALSYAEARAVWQSNEARANAERLRQMHDKLRLEQRIQTAQIDRQAAGKQRSAGARMKDIHDHDASSFARTGRAANGETRISRRLSVMATALERKTATLPEFIVDKTLGRSIFLDYQPAPKSRVLSLCGEDVSVGEHLLLRDVSVSLARDARVHLRGPNGSGKTTLIQALLSRAAAYDRLLYLPQELNRAQVDALRAAIDALSRNDRGRIMGILAALGIDPDRIQGAAAWSPGEARKLKLALGLAQHAWALILDEPTNHLDLPSVERLEAALAAYPGALLFTSHDATFARYLALQSWELEGQRVICR